MAESRSKATRRRFTVDALFSDTSTRGVGVEVLTDARIIRLDRIVPDPDQPRKAFDAERLEELAASIRAEGVLQPIAVRYDEQRDVYVVLHGERRLRAARMAELSSIPAIVRDVPIERRLLQQLMENVVREDLNALDRAAALRALKEQMGNPSWDRVAEAVGIRRSRLFQLLDTEKLAETLQEAIRRGLVSEKQTRALHRLIPELQTEIGDRVLSGEIHARDLPDAAQAVGDVPTIEAARDTLDRIRDTPRTEVAGQRRPSAIQSVVRQAGQLTRSLDAFDDASLETTDRSTREELGQALHDLRERIDDALRTLDGT